MRQGQISMTLDIAGYETAMEGEDMRAVVLTLDRSQTVPWQPLDDHRFICLPERPDGGGDARATKHLLNAGERCAVPPMTAHHVHGLDGGPCQFMVLQGTGVYDNVRVGGASD